MTGRAGREARTCCSTVTPSVSGSRMSRTRTSGLKASSSFSASVPLVANASSYRVLKKRLYVDRRADSSSTKSTFRGAAPDSMAGVNIRRGPAQSTARPPVRLRHAALDLEQVVELREHEQEAQLLVRPTQAHGLASLGRLALDQHQRAQAGRIHLTRGRKVENQAPRAFRELLQQLPGGAAKVDRKSTRLNSSHLVISYAVFCLKKKKKKKKLAELI